MTDLAARLKKMEIVVQAALEPKGPFGYRDHAELYVAMRTFLASADEWLVMPDGKGYGRNMVETMVNDYELGRDWWAQRGVVIPDRV